MTDKKKGATLRVEQSIPSVKTAITTAVDTKYVLGHAGSILDRGIYMIDNRLSNGSGSEGNMELHTCCNVGDVIGFEVVPIDSTSGDTVVITGFNVSAGNVFGSEGYPQPTKDPSVWLAQAMNRGEQTYQIQIKVTSGGIRPVSVYASWDPFIMAK